MTHSDLRIGNIVKLRDTGEIVRVCGINRHSVYFKKYFENDTYRDYSDIEGVLIYDHWREIDCPELMWRDDTDAYYYGGFTIHKEVRYLHELQNLHFALTGEELKIEL